MPAWAQPAANAPNDDTFNVEQLFASICGFCHSDGGRAAGRGPQLMNTQRSDDFIRNRIKMGKEGAMPAFGALAAGCAQAGMEQVNEAASTIGRNVLTFNSNFMMFRFC